MKYYKQETMFTCGCAAIRNALKFYGEKHSERKLRILAGTGKNGTSANGIIKALKVLGYESKYYEYATKNAFINKMQRIFKRGGVMIIGTENEAHWVAVVKDNGKYKIIESSREYKKTEIQYTPKFIAHRAYNIDIDKPKRAFYQLIEIVANGNI